MATYGVIDGEGNLVSIAASKSELADDAVLEERGLDTVRLKQSDIDDPLRIWEPSERAFRDATEDEAAALTPPDPAQQRTLSDADVDAIASALAEKLRGAT